ncbi:MAG: hypothetical protein J5940_02805 [Clostridia bacterium]|nr:hypothetical protein [Clostridia bacterium]
MKKTLCMLLIVSFALALFACGRNGAETLPEKEYTERQVNVRYIDGSLDTETTARFYDGIPYISIADYVGLLYRGREFAEGRDSVSVEVSGDKYTVTPFGGVKAVFDVKENTFETDNFALFKNTHLTEPGIEGCVPYDALPFIKVKSVSSDTEAVPMKFDFDDYGIDIYGDGGALYLPFTTLSDMFSCMNILESAYNGQDFYVYYYTADENLTDFGGDCINRMHSETVAESYAEYNYNELCLNYDMFLGRSGRSSLEEYYDLSGGLDAALESDEFGREVKRCLRSADAVEYAAGLAVLSLLMSDGGHSIYDISRTTYYFADGSWHLPSWITADVFDEIHNTATKILGYGDSSPAQNSCESNYYHGKIYEARAAALGKPSTALYGENTYTRVGDTAIIHIDGYMNDIYNIDAWNDYYAGKTDEIPFDPENGGAVGAAYYGLLKANEDGVKRIIIDMSANTGGSTDEMLYVISLLTNREFLYVNDRSTGQSYRVEYMIDRNLDRVFDEKDEEFDLIGDKELAVLTSRNGFSCGGISPVVLNNYGVYTLGENCGGGSCAIYIQNDAFGFIRRASCPMQICNADGVDTDTARLTSCDTALEVTEDGDGSPVYTAFFDVESLAALIDAHYAALKK